MGIVEAVSRDNEGAVLSVAGQRFSVSLTEADLFAVGDYVVAGAKDADTSALVYHVGLPYVPGVSPVRVKAPVVSVEPSLGSLTVGTLTVDFTAHLAVSPVSLVAGETVELVGVQPTFEGSLLLNSSGDGLYITSATEDSESDAGRE
jgi:hypothetical protein